MLLCWFKNIKTYICIINILKNLHMKIITVSFQKGGVGKSTTALNLYYALSKKFNVGVWDTDPQGTLNTLKPDDMQLIDCTEPNELFNLDYDIIIIDTPPYLSDKLDKIYKISDIILVPVKAGVFDLVAINATLNQIEEAGQESKTAMFFTMVINSSTIKDELYRFLKTKKAHRILNEFTSIRVDYIKSVLMKEGIFSSGNKTAIEETEKLCTSIFKLL